MYLINFNKNAWELKNICKGELSVRGQVGWGFEKPGPCPWQGRWT